MRGNRVTLVLALAVFALTSTSFIHSMYSPNVAFASCQDGEGVGAVCYSDYPNCDYNTSYCMYLLCGYEYECFAVAWNEYCETSSSPCSCGGVCGYPPCIGSC